jgi:hypothetical protein
MSPTLRLRMAHRVACQAIAEMVCADNEIDEVTAAGLIGSACSARIRATKGVEAAAEDAYRRADALAVTP